MSVVQIKHKIVGWEVNKPKTEEEIAAEEVEDGKQREIEYLENEIRLLKEKIGSLSSLEIVTADRSGEPLQGCGYKIEASPKDPNAYYINITDIVHNGRKRAYEIFINTKNPKHHQWIVALTRLATAIMRREENPLFVGEELSEAFDIEGGGYYRRGGLWFKGLADEIGNVLTQHIEGVIRYNENMADIDESDRENEGQVRKVEIDPVPESLEDISKEELEFRELNKNAVQCPECRKKTYVMSGGCGQCTNCPYSSCG